MRRIAQHMLASIGWSAGAIVSTWQSTKCADLGVPRCHKALNVEHARQRRRGVRLHGRTQREAAWTAASKGLP